MCENAIWYHEKRTMLPSSMPELRNALGWDRGNASVFDRLCRMPKLPCKICSEPGDFWHEVKKVWEPDAPLCREVRCSSCYWKNVRGVRHEASWSRGHVCDSHDSELSPTFSRTPACAAEIFSVLQEHLADDLIAPQGASVAFRPCPDSLSPSGSSASVQALTEIGVVVELAWKAREEPPRFTGEILCDPIPVSEPSVPIAAAAASSVAAAAAAALCAPRLLTRGTVSVLLPHHSAHQIGDIECFRAEFCPDEPDFDARVRVGDMQHALLRGAECKPVQLLSLGLENFESGQWSWKRSMVVQEWCAKFGGKRCVSYDFACKDGRHASDYETHCDMLLDSLFANSGHVVSTYERSEILFLDCRPLYNSDHDFRLRKHAGYHPKTLEGLLSSSSWNDFWQNAHEQIVSALQPKDVSKLLVVCYCKKGRHRSVGVRELLHHCLQVIGVKDIASKDLCSGRLWKFCAMGRTLDVPNVIRRMGGLHVLLSLFEWQPPISGSRLRSPCYTMGWWILRVRAAWWEMTHGSTPHWYLSKLCHLLAHCSCARDPTQLVVRMFESSAPNVALCAHNMTWSVVLAVKQGMVRFRTWILWTISTHAPAGASIQKVCSLRLLATETCPRMVYAL